MTCAKAFDFNVVIEPTSAVFEPLDHLRKALGQSSALRGWAGYGARFGDEGTTSSELLSRLVSSSVL